MNSIKNAIVTVTLLAVGYGSYVVLKDPNAELSDSDRIAQPRVNAIGDANIEIALPQDLDVSVGTPNVDGTVPPSNVGESESGIAHRTVSPDDSTATLTLDVPELPPLPAALEPGDTSPVPSRFQSEQADPVAASPFDKPIVEVANEPTNSNPLASKVEPPVASADESIVGHVPAGTAAPSGPSLSSDSPIVSPAEPANRFSASPVTEPHTDGVPDLPLVETAPVEPLETSPVPPVNKELGPIPPANETEGSLAFERVWSDVQDALRTKDLATALKSLTPWSSDSGLNQEQGERCLRLLDELAGTVIYSRESYLEPAYEVQAGEDLDEIAAKYGVPRELLAKINGIAPPYALTTSEKIKVVRGPFRATVSLRDKELTLFVGSHYAGRFPVKIGQDLPPEAAFYEVAEKSLGRSYFDRRVGREIIKGDAENRYGTRWLGLRGEHITTGHSVGIHGRPQIAAAEQTADGSISLDALHAEDVFSILSVGSRVEVRP